MTTDERTPLLSGGDGAAKQERGGSWLRRAFGLENRILFAGFLITLSFSFTQVPWVSRSPICSDLSWC
jgi:hypothetical protein